MVLVRLNETSRHIKKLSFSGFQSLVTQYQYLMKSATYAYNRCSKYTFLKLLDILTIKRSCIADIKMSCGFKCTDLFVTETCLLEVYNNLNEDIENR